MPTPPTGCSAASIAKGTKFPRSSSRNSPTMPPVPMDRLVFFRALAATCVCMAIFAAPGLAAEQVLAPQGGATRQAAAESGDVIHSLLDLKRHYGRTDVESLPVDLHARVNYWDVRDRAVFVQDQHSAIYLSVPFVQFERHSRLPPGTRIRVIGRLVMDGHYVQVETVEVSDDVVPVEPKSLRIEDLTLGNRWSQRVKTTGAVQEVARFGDLWIASCTSGDASFLVHRYEENAIFQWTRLIGHEVEMEGTLICEVGSDGKPTRYVVEMNEFDPPLRPIRHLEDIVSVDEAESRTIDQLRTTETIAGGLYQTSGQITSVAAGDGYLIESEGSGMFIATAMAREDASGHLVDVTVRRRGTNQFQAVSLHSRAFQTVPPPQRDQARSVELSRLPYRATIEADFIFSLSQDDQRTIMLRDVDTEFAATLTVNDATWEDLSLENARRVAVTGMVTAAPPGMTELEQDFSPEFIVELEGPDGVQVVSRWWQFSRSAGISALALIAVLGVAGMLCFATLWFRLQRTVRTNRRLELQLRESQKMDALGRLAGGVAHDFNNLLAAIASNLELIDIGTPRNDDQPTHCLASARRCTAQATKLVRSLLGFTRQTNLDLQVGNLNDVVEEAVLLAKTSLSPDVVVSLQLSPWLPPCRFDHAQLEQVLLNLLFNAHDALGRQTGTIILQTDPFVDADGSPFTRIQIRDDGHGMDHETRARVFEPFFTTKKVGEGTGLGLALSYGVINQHGGTIDCQSEPGHGSVFTILLPAAIEASASEKTNGDATPLNHSSKRFSTSSETCGERGELLRVDDAEQAIESPPDHVAMEILLVDDDDEVRRVAKLSLEAIGHRVTDAAGGREAIARVQRGETFDVVILDLMMPDVSGAETFRQLKAIRSDLPIIVCSGLLIEIEKLKQVSGRKPDASLSKPFQLADLQHSLRQVCPQPRSRTDALQAGPVSGG
ncbi:MAG: response regulator [Phycisphaera sp. RhM]|nr:response regulator [Phycisphaera sp. RhM]